MPAEELENNVQQRTYFFHANYKFLSRKKFSMRLDSFEKYAN